MWEPSRRSAASQIHKPSTVSSLKRYGGKDDLLAGGSLERGIGGYAYVLFSARQISEATSSVVRGMTAHIIQQGLANGRRANFAQRIQ